MRQVAGGWIYTVPMGVTLHCIRCPKEEGILRAGDECFMEDKDSSHVYCLKHIPAPKPESQVVVEADPRRTPKRAHRREWERVYG